jgi:Asp-tRNA(Asn)/Glu-tRNA(Gln) amidotransferase A subunit family amidase
MKDLDMFISSPQSGYDVSPNAQTGHPCVVVPYKFDRLASVGGSCPPAQAGWETKHQPIGAVIVGQLYEDDKILSVAHRFQQATDIHLKRPTL